MRVKKTQAVALIARITGFAAVFFGTTRLLDGAWLSGATLIALALAAGFVAWRIEQGAR
jgi:inner membrane protein involved in colicin E2 resistance